MSIHFSPNPPFVDVHTHRRKMSSADVVFVSNFSQKEFGNSHFTEGSTFGSVGLHPWFLTTENFKTDLEKLSQLVSNENIRAIGECGLDKLRGEDLVFQTAVFEAQIRLAESVSKPVVIHCVRAFGEVVSIKKRLKPSVPLIVHGFNKNEKVLMELLRNDFFISVGASILSKKGSHTEGSLFTEILPKIPLNRLFFETDAAEDVKISEIYETAAKIINVDLMRLKSVVYENFVAVFKA